MIDLSHLNDFVQLTPFKMETVASVLLSVREGDFLASLDLKDAYFQIPIHGSSRKLLRFMSEGKVYQFRALCFGLSTAPQVFTRVFAAVSAWAHSRGIRLRYLDDWLVLSSSEKKAKQAVQPLLSLCHTLGIVINEKKSDLIPSQTAKYLGMTIDTGAGKVFPSGASREIPIGSGEILYYGISPVSALAGDPRSPGFARAPGSSRSSSDALIAVASEDALVPRVRPSLASGGFAGGSETGFVLVDGEGPSFDGGSIRDTCAGSSPVLCRVFVGVGRSPPQSKRVRGVVRPEVAPHQSSRNEGPLPGSSGISGRCYRSSRDSDVRQLDGRGVRQQTRGHGFPGPVFVDQPPSEMDGEFRRPSRCEISTRREQRAGRSSQLSRASCRDRVVSPPSGGEVTASRLGQSVDRPFCNVPQRETALYCSLVPDPQAVFEDAFRHPWDDLDLYAFPPFPLVGRVIARVQESSRVAMTLVAPLWPEKEWFADLLLLLTQPPLALPCWDRLLRQPHCSLFHQGVHMLNLHAWRLSSVTSESQAFREGLLESCQGSCGSPPLDYNSRDGRSSVVGVVERRCSSETPLYQ